MSDKPGPVSKQCLSAMLEEYRTASSSREGYMKAYTQTNFYFGLIIAAFGLGIWKSFDWVFIIIPFMVVIQYSIVHWNQYHSFLAETFLEDLERRINDATRQNTGADPKLSYFTYYNDLFRSTTLIRGDGRNIPLFKPTFLLSTSLTVANVSLVTYSVWRGCNLLASMPHGLLLRLAFVSSIVILMGLLLVNYARTPKNMKPMFRQTLSKVLQRQS